MTKQDPSSSTAPRRSNRARPQRVDESEVADPPKADAQKLSKRARGAKSSTKTGAGKHSDGQETEECADEGVPHKPSKKSKVSKAASDKVGSTEQDAAGQPSSSKQNTSKAAKKQRGQKATAEPQASDTAAAKPAAAKPAAAKPAAASSTASKQAASAVQNSNQAAAADPACPKAHITTVAEDYDVMLNQTNIGANNNKYYRMQLLQEDPSAYWLWTRWGRVGDKGQTQLQGPFDVDAGQREFKKKFRSKVGAAFDDKDAARQVRSGKYSLVDLDSFSSPPTSPGASKPTAKVVTQFAKSKLERPTEELMNLIFSDTMFQQAMQLALDLMQEFDIDTERLPLGQLSKEQVQRGYNVLERLRAAITGGGESLARLSSEFYQVIPHNFGRQRPPIIASQSMVEIKIRMCDVLSDIEVAQDLLEPKEKEEERTELQANPADEKYATLMADLNVIPTQDEEYKIIERYCQATGTGQQLLNVWRVDRHSEAAGFAKHSKLDNRKLLWHGTNIAVVAAILKAGLRIMPHACGRVGKGLYLASEQSKSAAYVSCGRKGHDLIGVMFLAEAALGTEHHITVDDSSLRQAPPGFDSVVAKGHTEPDPSQDVKLELDGISVQVPQGKPVRIPQYSNSSFMQSEYLLYQESQARIRYMLTMKFSHAGSWR